VQRAKELLELVEDRLALQPHHAEWLSSQYNNSYLLDIKTCSDLMLVKVMKMMMREETSLLVLIGVW